MIFPPRDILKRRGLFQIRTNMVEDDPRAMLALMETVIVVRCEHRYDRNRFEYSAYSPFFEPIADGLEAPLYRAVFNSTELIVTWEKEGALG